MKRRRMRQALAPLLGALVLPLPQAAAAHGFGRLYNLPVPFELYAWGAGLALLLSFLLAGWIAAAPPLVPDAGRDLSASRFARRLRRALPLLRALSLGLLLLCILTGLFGSRDPYRNFNMTFFWVVFLLGLTYATVLVGNAYAALNPWRVLVHGLGRAWRGFTRGRIPYPQRWGDAPALALYLGFIAYELFAHGSPRGLAMLLLGYTALNLGGVWLFGAAAWFRHGEFFSVFFRLIALMAPLAYEPAEAAGDRGRLRWRWPFAGLVQERPAHLTTVAFVMALLATTAFDGLRATQWWVGLFWQDPTGLVTALVGKKPILAYAQLRSWYIGWEMVWLLALPFLYLAVFLLFLVAARRLAHSPRSLYDLALDFGYTLLPIAFVYHLTHYATLLLAQGPKIISLFSDPFGRQWNLFGTAGLFRAPILPDLGVLWHTQVGLILFGHIISLYAAHLVALRVFGSRGRAMLSQLPLLALMVLFTVAGLWILAQPLTAEKLR